MASVVAFDFHGGPLDGKSFWTNSPETAEALQAERLFRLCGCGTVGWRFRVPDAPTPNAFYQCTATGELADVLVIQCQHCPL